MACKEIKIKLAILSADQLQPTHIQMQSHWRAKKARHLALAHRSARLIQASCHSAEGPAPKCLRVMPEQVCALQDSGLGVCCSGLDDLSCRAGLDPTAAVSFQLLSKAQRILGF